jgi:hypothetical protein
MVLPPALQSRESANEVASVQMMPSLSPETAKKSRPWLFPLSLLLFIVCIAVGWMFAYPPYGVSDEPAHTIKALATANGQLSGDSAVGQFGYDAEVYRIPGTFSSIWHFICYSAGTDITPDCVGDFPEDPNVIENTSTASEYPPLFYALVGWIGWEVPTQVGFYLMRSMSAVLFLAVISLSLIVAHRNRFGAFKTAAVFVSCTPALVSFGPIINPFALEVALALLFWVAATSSLNEFDQRVSTPSRLIGIGVLFGLTRPASFVWMIAILGLLAIFYFRFSDLRDEIRRWWPVLIASLVSIFISLGWYFWQLKGASLGGGSPSSQSILSNVRYSFMRLDDYVLQLFGHFGWTSLYPPLLVPICAVSAIAVLAIPIGPLSRRDFCARWIACAVVGLAPLVLEGLRARSSGFGYQGRYLLPVAVGLPILFASGVSSFTVRRVRTVVALAGIAQLVALAYTAHRYLVGTGGPYWWIGKERWSPPIGGSGLALILLVAAVFLYGAVKSLELTIIETSQPKPSTQ